MGLTLHVPVRSSQPLYALGHHGANKGAICQGNCLCLDYDGIPMGHDGNYGRWRKRLAHQEVVFW